MSRIGKKPILIPSGVEVSVKEGEVKIKGPKGELTVKIRPEIEIAIEGNQIKVGAKQSDKESKVFWGLIRSLVNNAVKGVSEGYKKQLEIQGVGYRAKIEGDELIVEIGLSHPVKFKRPANIEFLVEKNIITISGPDRQLVGQIAASIRATKPPEPYKGKGIRYVGEVVIQKAGKRAAETTAS